MNSTQDPQVRQGAISIAESFERDMRAGVLEEGSRLPSIRDLADDLDVSPATVQSAYRILRTRGLVVATRRGTVVAPKPELPTRSAGRPAGAGRDVSDGNPDPRLLPDLGSIELDVEPVLYGTEQNVAELVAVVAADLAADGVPAEHVLIVSGAHDAVERALAAHLLPGDRVAVEDPGFTGTYDLVRAMGMRNVPVAIDDDGMIPASLAAVLADGVSAVVLTNRAQNPTGAALSADRAAALRGVLDAHPDVLVIEDDHAGPVAGVSFETTVTDGRQRWMVVRSFGKYIGPDVRVAALAADPLTAQRIDARLLVGAGWVSQALQRLALRGLTDDACRSMLETARRSYAERREALLSALDGCGVQASCRSGFNVWIPVERETAVWAALQADGWLVSPGEAFSIDAGPAIRITISSLDLDDIPEVAAAVARAVGSGTRAGR